MPTEKVALSYLATVARLGYDPSVPPADVVGGWELPAGRMGQGVVDVNTTSSILEAYSALHPEVSYGERPVPVACCLRQLSLAGEKGLQPLLMLPAELDVSGRLLPRGGMRAWIPRDCLNVEGPLNGVLTVCDLDAYRAHQVAMRSLPYEEDWPCALTHANDLFEAVFMPSKDELAALGAEVVDDPCRIILWDQPDQGLKTALRLDDLARRCAGSEGAGDGEGDGGDEESEPALSGPLSALLGLREVNESAEGAARELAADPTSDELAPQKLLCGIPDHLPSLRAEEHAVLATLAFQHAGDVLALEAPRGTNHAAVALAAVANLITDAALRGDHLPVTALVGSASSLDALEELLRGRPAWGNRSLFSRWLPRIAADSNGRGKRVLGALPALFVRHCADGDSTPRDAMHLLEPWNHAQGGDAALYADAWYVPRATTYYLDCVSGFLNERIRDAGQAASRLCERLRLVDQERCELIDTYAEVCRAADQLRRRDEMVALIGVLRRDHALCRERLRYWSDLSARHPAKRPLVMGGEPDQSELIARHAAPDERPAQGKRLLGEVVAAYAAEIGRIEREIDRLRGASATLSRRMRAATPAGSECSRIIARLTSLCKLGPAQTGLLESALDGSEASMELLDDVLDQTIRPAEFWLALHAFEARWVEAFQQDELRPARWQQEDPTTLATWAHLAPFVLVPDNLASGVLPCAPSTAHETLDLAVVLEGAQTDLCRAAALLGVSARALVLGDVAAGSPQPLTGAVFDEITAGRHLSAEEWEQVRERGLATSARQSAFSVLWDRAEVQAAALRCERRGDEALVSVRGELLRNGLVSVGRDANPELPHVAARARVLPPLAHVLVPDSSWEQVLGGRRNQAEGMALMRWLANHEQEIVELYGSVWEKPMALLVPYEAQAHTLRVLLEASTLTQRERMEVVSLREAADRVWPVVLCSSTCGPDALDEDASAGVRGVMSHALSCAVDSFVLFCGNAWARSDDEVARLLMGRSVRVGRLFSVERKRSRNPQAQLHPEVRAKPLALTALLKRMERRGDIAKVPGTAVVNKALAQAGLIERCKTGDGKSGWRPTAAGREAGIIATSDKRGNPFCSYSTSSEPVVASLIWSILSNDLG